jgi:ABC-type nitrate/sulfonate/bicarbonate transport system substrate-binding protein
MLRDKETDIAVILTEGIVKDIVAGNKSKIVQIYVQSPLLWGIHVDAKSNFQTIADLENKKAAISRLGSGSHLMSIVNAQNNNWNTQNLTFEIVNTIDGAVKALQNKTADYFMWEQFMTKPLVDNGTFRKISSCPTPWPCFVIAVRNEILENEPHVINQILEIINNTTIEFKQIPSIDRTIALKYDLQLQDVQEWLSLTQWSQKNIDKKTLENIQNQLLSLNIIEKTLPFEMMVK